MSAKNSIRFRGIEFCSAERSQFIPVQLTQMGAAMPVKEQHLPGQNDDSNLELAVWGDNAENRSYTQKIMQGIRAKGQHTIPQVGNSSGSSAQGARADDQSQEKEEPAGDKVLKDIGKTAAVEGGKILARMLGVPI